MGDIAGACQLLRLEKPALGVAEARSTRRLLSFIHRSAWNINSRKFISRIVDMNPIGPGLSRSWLERDAYEACSKVLRG